MRESSYPTARLKSRIVKTAWNWSEDGPNRMSTNRPASIWNLVFY